MFFNSLKVILKTCCFLRNDINLAILYSSYDGQAEHKWKDHRREAVLSDVAVSYLNVTKYATKPLFSSAKQREILMVVIIFSGIIIRSLWMALRVRFCLAIEIQFACSSTLK